MEVVTLGGLIAGACIAGIGSALVQILVWKLGGSYLTEAGFAVCGQQLSNYGYYAFAARLYSD